ncbi:lysocardiolipin acyltransferase 1-like [Biomphalaria glabrata]|uniref:Lysocardiolipin acyltransferase 1-like n=1 Tax=Biomphalaria glabrata TaxID=6526 RepID=A0A2C9JJ61_BIOGL|nr:lysocardiolipin acyltransferase 1-like [Biomphalaria glabrata]XP_055879914.1 lysocardiolipin acyltransferase 1-like [Biomphalaria glabrata]KAI8784401.1 lysocardiolipin acyltransferase 1 [Biomphalaria glabrata]
MSLKNLVYGSMLACMLFLSSTMGTIVMVTPTLPVIFLSPTLSRRMMDFLIKLWFLLAVAMYELLIGVKIKVFGEPALRGTSSLILSNHRTRLDWLFLMSYLCRYSAINEYRISLKASLKKFPGAGWAMQCAGFLFLNRKWEEDKDHISRGLHYFSQVKSKPQFLLFPEGTDMCPNAIKRSNMYAEKEQLVKYEYVLHPRTTGFIHFVKEMKKGHIIDSILDVTVAYPKKIVQSELQTLKGEFPEEIHFFVKNYPIDTLPETDQELAEWLTKLWSEKEARLKKFYEEKTFSCDGSGQAGDFLQSGDWELKKLLYSVVVFWVVFLLVVFTGLLISPAFRVFCLISSATYVIIGIRHGGVDNVIYTAVNNLKN